MNCFRRNLTAALAGACLVFGHGLAASAQTSWQLDGHGVWQNATNWSPAVVPNAADGSVLLGPVITSDVGIRLGANTVVGTLSIDSAYNYTLSGFSELRFNGPGAAAINVTGGGSPEITGRLRLLDSLTIDQDSAGTFKISGDFWTTDKSVTKTGLGTLEMTAYNAFGGGLFINEGTVRAYSETSLGNGDGLIVQINGGVLNLGANITTDGTRSYNIGASGGTIDVDGGYVFNLAQAGTLAGTSAALTKEGTGSLILGGDNSSTFTGSLTINNGLVQISSEANLGAAANDVTLNGGELRVTSGFTANSGKVFTFGSNGGAISVDRNQTLTLGSNGQLAGTGEFNKNGDGTIVLGGDNSAFTGTTRINSGTVRVTDVNNLGSSTAGVTLDGGTLNVGGTFTSARTFTMGSNGGTMSIDNGQTLTLASTGQLAGSGGLTVSGGGTLSLTGNQNAYTGSMVVSGSTLSMSGAAGTATGISQLTIRDRGTLLIDNTTVVANRLAANIVLNGGTISMNSEAAVNEVLGSLTLAGGSSYVSASRPGSGGNYSPEITFSSLARSGSEATVHFASSGTSGVLGGGGKKDAYINFSSAPSTANGIIGGWATAQASSLSTVEFATMNGNSVRALTSWDTGKNPNNWDLTVNAKPGADISLSTRTNVNSLTLTSGRTVTATGRTLTIGSGGLISQANGNVTGGNLTVGTTGVGGTLFAHVASGGNLTISSIIGNNGAGAVSVVKANEGTLTLSGANTYTGGTFVNQGTLTLGAANVIPNSSAVTVSAGGTFNMANNSDTVASLAGNGAVTLGSATLTAGGNNSSTEFSGVISGTGGLTKTGSGTMILSGANMFTGALGINGGTVSAAQDSNLGAGSISINGGALNASQSFTSAKTVNMAGAGTISVDADKNLTLGTANQITGTGALTKSGSGTLTVAGGSSFSGGLVINGGEVVAAGTSANVASFLDSTRVGGLTGSGGTLTWAHSTANQTNTIGVMPSSPSSIKMGFDVSGGATGVAYIIGPTNQNLNWAGLVIKGGEVQLGSDHTLVGTSSTTLEMTGGTLYLAGQNPTGGKTLEISGNATLSGGSIHGGPGGGSQGTLKTGGSIISDGTILLNSPNIVMTATGAETTTYVTGTTPLNGVHSFTKQGAGTVQLNQSLYITQELKIEQGTVLLGADNRLNDTVPIVMSGGAFATGGHSDTVGTLTLLNSSSLDLGAGNTSVLAFHDSSSALWGSSLLTIENYHDDHEYIYFGTTSSGLTSTQLEQVRWMDPFGPDSGVFFGALIEADGRIRPIVPVPEPATVVAMVLLAGLIGWRERKRLGSGVKWVLSRGAQPRPQS